MMPTRAEMDKPATTIAAVLGIVIILGSLPFTVIAFCDKNGCGGEAVIPKDYDVTWGALAFGHATADVANGRLASEAGVPVQDKLLANATLAVPAGCTDEYNTQADLGQQPAVFNYTLVRRLAGGTDEPVQGGSGSFACTEDVKANGLQVEVPLRDHPNIALVQGNSSAEATAKAWAANPANDTAEYVLSLTAYRPPSQVPLPPTLPVGQTSLSARMDVHLSAWGLAVNEREPEVLR